MTEKTMEVKTETFKGSFSLKEFMLKYNALLLFVLLLIASSILSPAFFSKQNIFNVLRQQSPYLIVSMGVLLTIVTGGIDLSVGSTVGIGGIIVAKAITEWGMTATPTVILAIVVTAIVGGIVGSLNGVLIAKLKMAPFIITLASMTMLRGIAYILSNGQPIRLIRTIPAAAFLTSFGENSDPLLGVPYPIWLAFVILAVFFLIMKYTGFGRYLIATGSNEHAVRLSGISVFKYKYSAYVIAGALASLAGVVLASRAAISTPAAGAGFELDVIAGCVIGGASLSGGKGSVINTIIGVLIVAMIGNIMNLLSIAIYQQQVMKGAIIIFAVLIRGVSEKEQEA